MPAPEEKPPDQQQIVAALAAECHMPVVVMARLYERERAALARGARITKFLHIFARRNVLEALHRRGPALQLAPPAQVLIGALPTVLPMLSPAAISAVRRARSG
jgi:hypothetical protein